MACRHRKSVHDGYQLAPETSPTSKFLTVAEVAAMMRVSKMTVYRLVHSGELPAVRVGRSFRVLEEDVERVPPQELLQRRLTLAASTRTLGFGTGFCCSHGR